MPMKPITKAEFKETVFSITFTLAIIMTPFLLFMIPISTKGTLEVLDGLRNPGSSWEVISTEKQGDSFYRPDGTANTVRTFGNPQEYPLNHDFVLLAENVIGMEFSSIEKTPGYSYACSDEMPTCSVSVRKSFEKYGDKTINLTKIIGDDKQRWYEEYPQYKTILVVQVSDNESES